MDHLNLLLIGLIAACGIASTADGRKIINCYYDTFMHIFPDKADFIVDEIHPFLCTHISYTFFNIDPQSGEVKAEEPLLTEDKILREVHRASELKRGNPNLKIMLIVSGWTKTGIITASPSIRKPFIESTAKIIEKYNFDGLNLDLGDLPRFGDPEDKTNLVTLLIETHKVMKSMGKQFDVTVLTKKETDTLVYDIPEIATNVDFINIKTFDVIFPDSKFVYVKQQLKDRGTNSLKSAIKYWMDQGVPASKLVLSLTLDGSWLHLISPKMYKRRNLIERPIAKNIDWTPYHYICENKNMYTNNWSDEHNVPYLVNGRQLIIYDNVKSVESKADLINSLNLAGVMVWPMNSDDFRGICGDGKFPLLNAIINKMADPPNSPSVSKKSRM